MHSVPHARLLVAATGLRYVTGSQVFEHGASFRPQLVAELPVIVRIVKEIFGRVDRRLKKGRLFQSLQLGRFRFLSAIARDGPLMVDCRADGVEAKLLIQLRLNRPSSILHRSVIGSRITAHASLLLNCNLACHLGDRYIEVTQPIDVAVHGHTRCRPSWG